MCFFSCWEFENSRSFLFMEILWSEDQNEKKHPQVVAALGPPAGVPQPQSLSGWCIGSMGLVRIFYLHLHPRRLTWNLKMMVLKMIFLFNWVISGFHVIFRGVPLKSTTCRQIYRSSHISYCVCFPFLMVS